MGWSKDITFIKWKRQLNILTGFYVSQTRTPLTPDKAVPSISLLPDPLNVRSL